MKQELYNFLITLPEYTKQQNSNLFLMAICVLFLLGMAIVGIYNHKRGYWKFGQYLKDSTPVILFILALAIPPTYELYNTEKKAEEYSRKIETVLANPQTRILSVHATKTGEPEAVIGWNPTQKTKEVEILGKKETLEILEDPGVRVTLPPKVLAYLASKNITLAGTPLKETLVARK